LVFEDGSTLPLDASSASNTGLDLFYVNTGNGLSCAGCHPDGDEDGRTWSFPQGLRRTQPLGGGVMSRAPFHWDGEIAAMDDLVAEVMLGRMSFETPLGAEQIAILGRWLDSIPAPPSGQSESGNRDGAAVERGRLLFSDDQVGCASCHFGETYADGRSYDVGTGGMFYTPTLLGVGLRAHLMHDGCATNLTERFGVCGGGDLHGKTSDLDAANVDDLVAFMRTL
jgi:cytochrome c